MNRRWTLPLAALSALAVASATLAACGSEPALSRSDRVARGAYIVNAFGCTDCHTPFRMGPKGPERDHARELSGHPDTTDVGPAPVLPPGRWNATVSDTMTAWSGPWGTTFTANLTPDYETGLGAWTEDDFVRTFRTGRRMGKGREILPPMPVEQIRNLSDDDLKAVFAYLKTLPPVRNRVLAPLPPASVPPAAPPASDAR